MRDPAPSSPLTALRARLGDLTIRDEVRLGRRLERLRGDDDARRARRLTGIVDEIEQAERRIGARREAVPEIAYPDDLPVAARRDDLLAAIEAHQVVVVAGETGSGKTTQLPKICLELGRGIRGTIAHTQPRRIAARNVAQRIADELAVPLGGAVGYSVRFNDRSGRDTLVRLMTDGLLLAETRHDRLLRRYDTIIVDEAHERSLNIDFLLGYLHTLLPRRPDLKLIVTSATIDPERFSAHFGGAPIVEVSGRTYPVEVRYRPFGGDHDERDQVDAIGDAVEELVGGASGRPGDTLVFLSGEREIRDAAEALGGRFDGVADVLPLYARLSTAEQQRVFAPGPRPRIVLATNVAETSLTVPGVRYVVDAGSARISRYSVRHKVQRLPIEPISQASAQQRAGRCGRVADGICIRLYSEDDFAERAPFTDPEILRTNLAAVLLQMALLELGDIDAFPFLEPPDRRQVRDGLALLHELAAVGGPATAPATASGLTDTGRIIAHLPIDPRLGRMIVEGGRRRCASEVAVIAAALSIQDPRERPADQQAQADQAHARYRDEQSDFLTYLVLWREIRAQRRTLSGSAFRRWCRENFLHYLRIREWQDLVSQIREAAREAGVTFDEHPGEPQDIHAALLSGLLSHVGLHDRGRGDYVGARGTRFQVFPGSTLKRRRPPWLMAAELVETSRLWGRECAAVDPRELEALAEHLVRRTHLNPRWSRSRGAAVATEQVTLYGLPLVTGRTIAYARHDPELARELFLRSALVERDWDCRHEFFAENGRRLRQVEEIERRERRRDILAGDDVLYDFFDARVPEEIVDARAFDRWWRQARQDEPSLLTTPLDLLVRPEARDALAGRGRPTRWRQGDREFDLVYRYEPGGERDGVTIRIPLDALGGARSTGFEWLVPALRPELVEALLRGLPKAYRRELLPIPDVAAVALAAIKPRSAPLPRALAAALAELRGLTVDPDRFDLAALPPHLRMHIEVVESAGGPVLAAGDDLEALRRELAPRLRSRLAAQTAELERDGLRSWPPEPLPAVVALEGAGDSVRGYPALVDAGDSVAIRVLDSRARQAAAMAGGVRRLLDIALPDGGDAPLRALSAAEQLALATTPHDGGVRGLLADARRCALDEIVAAAGLPADEAAFERLRAHAAGLLAGRVTALVAEAARILDAARAVEAAIAERTAAPFEQARLDVARQLGGLVFDGFLTAATAAHVGEIAGHLAAAARRLERLPDRLAADRDRLGPILELERELDDARAAGRVPTARLADARWALHALRSQQLGGVTVGAPASARQIRRLLGEGPDR